MGHINGGQGRAGSYEPSCRLAEEGSPPPPPLLSARGGRCFRLTVAAAGGRGRRQRCVYRRDWPRLEDEGEGVGVDWTEGG